MRHSRYSYVVFRNSISYKLFLQKLSGLTDRKDKLYSRTRDAEKDNIVIENFYFNDNSEIFV